MVISAYINFKQYDHQSSLHAAPLHQPEEIFFVKQNLHLYLIIVVHVARLNLEQSPRKLRLLSWQVTGSIDYITWSHKVVRLASSIVYSDKKILSYLGDFASDKPYSAVHKLIVGIQGIFLSTKENDQVMSETSLRPSPALCREIEKKVWPLIISSCN